MNDRSRERWQAWLVLLLPVLWSSARAETESRGADAARAFERLAALVGQWEGRFDNGRSHRVTYRLTAGGAALVETWALAPGRESMTLYHRDGDALLADHYCPQGNTPRLEFARVGSDGTLFFEFRDGANLRVPGKSHQHAFWIRTEGPSSYLRSETYLDNGAPAHGATPDATVRYTRVATSEPP